MGMSEAERAVRDSIAANYEVMRSVMTKFDGGESLSVEDRTTFDQADAELTKDKGDLDRLLKSKGSHSDIAALRGGTGTTMMHGVEDNTSGLVLRDANTDYENPNLVLRSTDSYAKWLNAQPEGKRTTADPGSFDKRAFFKAIMTNQTEGVAEIRAAMNEGTSADGGYLVPSPVAGEFVDMLRAKIFFMLGNSHMVPWVDGKTLALPIATADPLVQNLAEGVDSDPPSSDMTVSEYVFTARPYFVEEKASWELLEDSALDLVDVIQQQMTKRLAVNLQSDFIYSSTSNHIQGFTNAGGLLTLVEGGGPTNGAAPTSANGYTYWDKSIAKVRSANNEPDMIVTSPLAQSTYGQLKNTLNDRLTPSYDVEAYLMGTQGKSLYTTTSVSDVETAGTASGDCSDLFVLNSSMIYAAIRHGLSFMPLHERFATTRQLGIVAWLRADAVLVHPEAAVWLQGIKTS